MDDAPNAHEMVFFLGRDRRRAGGSGLEYLLTIFDGAGDLIEWATLNYGRWSLLGAGCLFIGITYFVSRSPKH
jgi:hypothetical protein